MQLTVKIIQTKKKSPEKGKKGAAKEGTPRKESGATKATKKAKANPAEEKQISSKSPRPAVNPQHQDNSLTEFRRLCAGIAELPGMPSLSSLIGAILKTGIFQATSTSRPFSASGCHRVQAKRSLKETCSSGSGCFFPGW